MLPSPNQKSHLLQVIPILATFVQISAGDVSHCIPKPDHFIVLKCELAQRRGLPQAHQGL